MSQKECLEIIEVAISSSISVFGKIKIQRSAIKNIELDN